MSEVLVIQATAVIAAYGYLFRDLAGWERSGFGIVPALGFDAIVGTRPLCDWALFALVGALVVWILVSVRLRPAAAKGE